MEKTTYNCLHCGKIISGNSLRNKSGKPVLVCPDCGSLKNYRNGWRRTNEGRTQKFICRDCGH